MKQDEISDVIMITGMSGPRVNLLSDPRYSEFT